MLEIAVVCYVVISCFIAFYSVSQFILVVYSTKFVQPQKSKLTTWPKVLIQLPIYNEVNVVEDLLQAVNQIVYPTGLLEVQVLDDSTDSTKHVIENWIATNSLNHKFTLIHRTNRVGFKAGALHQGLLHAEGEFVAIFDADFLPNTNFLIDAIPLFQNQQIGVVQTKWTYINENESLLTKLQAFGLKAHFQVEQQGRSALEAFLNFNGTAGIWRTACIENAGGWKFDSLTEDLDLSYRAQLQGYKIVYSPTIETPSLLPNNMLDVKNQQFRWTKGAAQCLRLHVSSLWKSNKLGLLQKVTSTFHLANELVFPAVLLASILSIAAVYYKAHFFSGGPLTSLLLSASALVGAFLVLALFYFKAHKAELQSTKRTLYHLFKYYLPFLSFTMALSVKNSRAVVEGLFGIKSEFVRTPKQKNGIQTVDYTTKKLSASFYIEVVLFIFYVIACFYAIFVANYSFIIYYGLLSFGFGAIIFMQLKD